MELRRLCTGFRHIVSDRNLAKVRRRKSPFLYLEDDETSLDDDETGKIYFKNLNCAGLEFGASTKTNIAIPLLEQWQDRLGQ